MGGVNLIKVSVPIDINKAVPGALQQCTLIRAN